MTSISMKIPAWTTRSVMARVKVNEGTEEKGHPSIGVILDDCDSDRRSYSYITALYAVTRIFY